MSNLQTTVDPESPFSLKKIPRQSRARATVEAILDAGARILIESGYTSASTNRIAERAGVSIGSLYEYFPGKEAIFAELRRREGLRWYTALVAPPRPVEPRAVIRHLVTGRVRFVAENLALYTALEAEIPRTAVQDLDDAVFADFLEISLSYFESHRHELRPFADSKRLAELLMRTISATIHDYAIHAPERLDAVLTEDLITLIERYLLP